MSTGFGIDIGAASVTVAALSGNGGSLALDYYRHYLLDVLVPEGDPTPGRIAHAIAAKLNDAGVRPRNVRLGVSGRDAIIRYSHLPPMPDWRLKLLMEFEIADVAERTGEALSADFQVLPGSDGNLVLVALAKDARVKEIVDAFADAGIEINGAVPQPVAAADCYRYLGEETGAAVTLVLDIGQESTEVSLVEENELIFARSVALGGSAFTDCLCDELGLKPSDAEAMKLQGDAAVERALARPRAQLANMVSASVDFAKRQLRRQNLSVDLAVIGGGSARVPGLVKAIAATVGCQAELFEPIADLGRPRADASSRTAAEEFGLESITATGLALSGILSGASKLNLLPLELKERLEFRHRTIWLYVSAAVLAASLLVSFALGGWEYSGEGSRREALVTTNAAMGTRLSAHEERVASNDRRDTDLRALSDRARPGFHLASLLTTLGSVMPAQISLVEANLIEDSGRGAFHFEFTGLADDAQGEGVSAMRKLKLELETNPLIAAVKLVPQGPEGTARRFRMTVEPKGNPTPTEAE